MGYGCAVRAGVTVKLVVKSYVTSTSRISSLI
jgi:hypothetical protein